MKTPFKNLRIISGLLLLLVTTSLILLSFKNVSVLKDSGTKKGASVKKVLSGCTGDCASYKAALVATYNNSNGDKCAAVKGTVNGIISGQCNCPGHPFDPCNLRQYAINTFPACHFTLSSFISSCP